MRHRDHDPEPDRVLSHIFLSMRQAIADVWSSARSLQFRHSWLNLKIRYTGRLSEATFCFLRSQLFLSCLSTAISYFAPSSSKADLIHISRTMNNRPVEQALSILVPTHANDLPQELLSYAISLVAQSRSFSSSLKPEEEIARPYACAEIACRRCATCPE